MIQLFINNEEVELTEDLVFSITKQFTDLQDLTSICTDYSKTIKVPRSPKNEKIFNYAFHLERNQGDVDFSKKVDARLESNLNILLQGYVVLNTTTATDYEITLYGQLGKLFRDFNKHFSFESIYPSKKMNAQLVADSFENGVQKDSYATFTHPFNFPGNLKITYIATIEFVLEQNTDEVFFNAGDTTFSFRIKENQNTTDYEIRGFVTDGTSRGFSRQNGVKVKGKHLYRWEYDNTTGNHILSVDGISVTINTPTPFTGVVPCLFPAGTYGYVRVWPGGHISSRYYEFLPHKDEPTGQWLLYDDVANLSAIAQSGFDATTYNVVGFCSTHQGQYVDFNSTRSTFGELTMDKYNNQFTGITEHSLREFRSYYQQPYIHLKSFFERLRTVVNSDTAFGWKLEYDGHWTKEPNPYWNKLIMMGKAFYDRQNENIDNDGPQNPFKLRGFVGHQKECLENIVDGDWKLVPQIENYSGDLTLQNNTFLIEDYRLLRGNIDPTWHYFADPTVQQYYAQDFGTFCLAIRDNSQWYPWYYAKTNVFLNPGFGFIFTIYAGNYTKKVGFYRGVSIKKNTAGEWEYYLDPSIQSDVYNLFQQNNVTEIYPLADPCSALRNIDEHGNYCTDYIFPLKGFEKMGFLSTVDTGFTFQFQCVDLSHKQLKHLLVYEDGTPVFEDDFCVSYLGIPIGNYGVVPEDEGDYKNNAVCDIFYSDVDSRRSGSVFGLDKILAEEDTPMQILIKYAKMFRLYFDVDYINKTITLTDRYFDASYKPAEVKRIIDWTDKVDYSTLKVNPVVANDEEVNWGYGDSDMKYNKTYKLRTGLNYGDYKYVTGIDTLNTKNVLFEDFPLSCVSLEKYPTYLEDVNSYELVASKETCPVAIDGGKNSTEAGQVSLYGSFYFLNTPQTVNSFKPGLKYPGSGYYIVSDDSLDMTATGEYYWNFSGIKVPRDKFPFVDYITMNDEEEGQPQILWGCTFGEPLFRYTNVQHYTNVDPKVHYINELWEDWLGQIYDKNNKKITCKVYLTDTEFSNFKFYQFVKIQDNIFLVTKIKDFKGRGLTEVELIQIKDINALGSKWEKILNG